MALPIDQYDGKWWLTYALHSEGPKPERPPLTAAMHIQPLEELIEEAMNEDCV